MKELRKVDPPKGYVVWTRCKTAKGDNYLIVTRGTDKTVYFLYKVEPDGKMERVAQRQNPAEFEKIIFG